MFARVLNAPLKFYRFPTHTLYARLKDLYSAANLANSPFKRFYIGLFFQACVRNFKGGLLLKEKSGKVFQTFEKPIEETVVEPTFRNTAT